MGTLSYSQQEKDMPWFKTCDACIYGYPIDAFTVKFSDFTSLNFRMMLLKRSWSCKT
eukprot:c54684_g1_i1 orf=1-168(-)